MNNDLKWNLLQAQVQRLQTLEVYQTLHAFGIDCMILKGAAIGRFYPPDKPRISVDVDISVAPVDYEKCLEHLKRGEFKKSNIDIHRGMRHFDTRDWDDVFEKSRIIEFEDGEIRVLSDEDQLRMICVHWLTDGGERKDRLWDLHFMIKNRAPGFDWDYFLDSNGRVRRQWIISAIGLAHRYTGLEIHELPFASECENLQGWLIRTVESRWADDVKFAPLDIYFRHPVMFVRQLKRRFPPNAVMATIALDEGFDNRSRLPIQIRYMIKRLVPSIRRSVRTFWRMLSR